MLVYASQLDVRLKGVGYDEAIDDSLCDGLGYGMAKEALDLDTCRVLRGHRQFRWVIIEDVRECSRAEGIWGHGGCASDVRVPAIDLSLQPGSGILFT